MVDRTCLLTSTKYLPIQECHCSLKMILSLNKTVTIHLSCNNNFYSKFLKIHKIIFKTATYHLLKDLIQIYSCQILSLNHLSNFPPWRQAFFTWPVRPCPLPLCHCPPSHSHHSAFLIPPRDHTASTGWGLCTCSHFPEYSSLA